MPQINSGDTAWVLASAALVLFMTPGLALFYGGMVRAKSVLAIMIQVFMCIGVVTLVWVTIGFSLAFGKDAYGGIIGNFGLVGLGNMNGAVPGFSSLHIPLSAYASFQMMFAIITAALIAGGTADRLKFTGFAIFVVLWVIFVYCPLAHWAFSPFGWLAHRGMLDFAGGTVVEINSGFSTLAVVLVIGKRKGWPREPMLPHSVPLTVVGAGILWFGWFGFNAGSALGANSVASEAFLTTQIAAAMGLLGWIIIERIFGGHYTTLGATSGAVAGMVAITPCAGFVTTFPAIVIGTLAGAICALAVKIKFKFGFDDSLDVLGIHGVGGVIGMFLLGLFATNAINKSSSNGLFYGGGLHLMSIQVLGIIASAAWAFGVSYLLAFGVHKTIGLRVSPASEDEGLDTSQHSERAYSSDNRT